MPPYVSTLDKLLRREAKAEIQSAIAERCADLDDARAQKKLRTISALGYEDDLDHVENDNVAASLDPFGDSTWDDWMEDELGRGWVEPDNAFDHYYPLDMDGAE